MRVFENLYKILIFNTSSCVYLVFIDEKCFLVKKTYTSEKHNVFKEAVFLLFINLFVCKKVFSVPKLFYVKIKCNNYINVLRKHQNVFSSKTSAAEYKGG